MLSGWKACADSPVGINFLKFLYDALFIAFGTGQPGQAAAGRNNHCLMTYRLDGVSGDLCLRWRKHPHP
jgi:hypothetical protein